MMTIFPFLKPGEASAAYLSLLLRYIIQSTFVVLLS